MKFYIRISLGLSVLTLLFRKYLPGLRSIQGKAGLVLVGFGILIIPTANVAKNYISKLKANK